jgi:hypothetical protein
MVVVGTVAAGAVVTGVVAGTAVVASTAVVTVVDAAGGTEVDAGLEDDVDGAGVTVPISSEVCCEATVDEHAAAVKDQTSTTKRDRADRRTVRVEGFISRPLGHTDMD